MDSEKDNIKVMVRVRPLNDREKREEAKACVVLDSDNPTSILLDSKPEPKQFYFDYVVGEGIRQEDIFHIVGKTLTNTCLEGYNGCIFAYGQTGAGKTFTMQGRGLDEEKVDSVNRGLQPRVFDYLFAQTKYRASAGILHFLAAILSFV
jgi:chromosomal replication initiation ATPase DnaA